MVTGMLYCIDDLYIKMQSKLKEIYVFTRTYFVFIPCLCHNNHQNGHYLNWYFIPENGNYRDLYISTSNDKSIDYVLIMHGPIWTKQKQYE